MTSFITVALSGLQTIWKVVAEMNRSIARKFFFESWLLWLALAIGVVIFCWFRVWVVGELDSAQFRQIIDLLPKDWRKFTTVDFDWLVSYLGRTSLCLDEPMLVLLMCSWAIVRASDVVSGELQRGSMELILAQPIRRGEVYWTHSICTVIGLLLLALLAWIAMAVGIWSTSVTETTYPTFWIPILDSSIPLTFLNPKTETIAMGSVVNPAMFLPGVLKLFLMALFFGGFSAWLSAMDRYRWRTLGLAAAFYFSNAGIKMLSMASENLRWMRYLNIFGYFEPAKSIESFSRDPNSLYSLFTRNSDQVITGTGNLIDCGVMLLLAIILFAVGARIFDRRDLPAPV